MSARLEPGEEIVCGEELAFGRCGNRNSRRHGSSSILFGLTGSNAHHLEMGKFVNTAANHKRMIELTGRDNMGIQLDWFHVNLEELDPYAAAMDAQPLLWHLHFRDSNSITPGYGKTDFRPPGAHAQSRSPNTVGIAHSGSNPRRSRARSMETSVSSPERCSPTGGSPG